MMAKDLGNKYHCAKCGTKFYDLKKPDPICPKCGADQRELQSQKPASESRRTRLSAVPKIVEPLEPMEESEVPEEEEFEEEEPPTDDEDV